MLKHAYKIFSLLAMVAGARLLWSWIREPEKMTLTVTFGLSPEGQFASEIQLERKER